VAGSVAVDRLSSERAYQNPERGTEPSYVVRSRIGGIRGVAMGGELDVMSARHLVSVAADVGDTTGLTPDGRLPFFIDLENVTFIDSDGLRALGGICRQVSSRGEQLLVTTPTAAGVRRLLTFAVSRGWLPNAFAPHDCVSV
jgi:anti-anti-sigma factor